MLRVVAQGRTRKEDEGKEGTEWTERNVTDTRERREADAAAATEGSVTDTRGRREASGTHGDGANGRTRGHAEERDVHAGTGSVRHTWAGGNPETHAHQQHNASAYRRGGIGR